MKAHELKNLSEADLKLKEKALKEELFKLNQQRYSGRVEKPHMFAQVKKDIARVMTLLRQKAK